MIEKSRSHFAINILRRWKRLESTLENAKGIGNSETVIAARHSSLLAAQNAGKDLPPVPHTRATIDYKFIGGNILGEVMSLNMNKIELSTDILL
jgi:hypothetical protein